MKSTQHALANFQSWMLAVVSMILGGSTLLCSAAFSDPEQSFHHPGKEAKPGVWWHWMGSNVSREGITRDLESFKEAGISSATIFGMADVCTPWAGHIDNPPNGLLLAFTDPWWKFVRHAAAEGKRLGIDVGIHNCPGYTSTGGPWITPELAMQQIFHSRTEVEGGKAFSGNLPKPEIDPRGDILFPMVNKETGVVEKPIIEGRKTYWRDIAVLAVPAEGVIAKDRILDLTNQMDSSGRLRWTPPDATKWSIYRFGHTTMGALTQPNQWEIMGLECDKMSEKAVTFHLQHVLGDLKKHLGPLVGTGLQHMLLDSYEAGTPSWTPLMPQEFQQRRGYGITEFLPVFAGRVVAGDGETAKFRADFDRTIADLYRDVLFKVMQRMLREANLRFVCEPYGGPFHTGEVTPHVDRVMTEFWSADRFNAPVQDGIMNAGEGKLHNILEAEAFTGAPDKCSWIETPGWLKTVGDEQLPDDCEWTGGPRGNGKFLKRFPDWFVKKQSRTSGRIGFTTWNYFTKDAQPISSGLIGPVSLMIADGKRSLPLAQAEASVNAGAQDAFEAELPRDQRIIPTAVIETGSFPEHSGPGDAAPLFNGTTRNGSGGGETLRDEKTYRPNGAGNTLLMKLPGKNGSDLREIQTFAGHGDVRASQAYRVWIAKADAPDLFIKVADARANSAGGSTRLKVPINISGVAVVSLEFADGPIGVNVYREMVLSGKSGAQ